VHDAVDRLDDDPTPQDCRCAPPLPADRPEITPGAESDDADVQGDEAALEIVGHESRNEASGRERVPQPPDGFLNGVRSLREYESAEGSRHSRVCALRIQRRLPRGSRQPFALLCCLENRKLRRSTYCASSAETSLCTPARMPTIVFAPCVIT